jgi:hypothetical protein
MPTTYTPLLGLAQPATGEETGNWGNIVNNFISNYVDSAVAGSLTVTGDTTLTKTTGSSLTSTSSQYAVIIASPASVNITITAPAASKTYVVLNTSGTYTVTFKATGQTGVVLAASERCVVAFNGTDFVKISSSTASGAVTAVTATAPVASSGGATPVISMPAATASVNGYLTSANWTTFNSKQGAISLTTIGTSGAATFNGTTLNVPNYATSGSAATPTTLGTVYANTTAAASPYTVALGYQAGTGVTGTYNIALGYRALTAAGAVGTTGNYNIGVGDESLGYVTSGSRNIGIGHNAAYVVQSGNDNIGIGYSALSSMINRNNNVGIGTNALTTLQSGEGNVAVGYGAAASIRNISSVTAIGYSALTSANSNYHTGVGYFSLSGVTSGTSNTGIGWGTGSNITTQSNNTALGAAAMYTSAFSNSTCLGANTDVTGDNQVQLGDASTTTYYYAIAARSDLRDKTDVRDTQLGLGFINALRPVDYRWDMREDYKPPMPEDTTDEAAMAAWRESVKLTNLTHDGSKKRTRFHHGLIAQEVKAVLDAQGIDFGGYQDHKVKGGDDVLSIGYDELIAPLIKAIQELTARVQELEAKA